MNSRQIHRLQKDVLTHLASLTPEQLLAELREVGPFVEELPPEEQELARFDPKKTLPAQGRKMTRARR